MSVREATATGSHLGTGGMIPGDVELAHRDINVRDQLERGYLNNVIVDMNGDAAKSWLNYRRIGEVRYAVSRSARIAGHARLVAAKVDQSGHILQTKDSGVEADIVAGITSRFGGTRGLIERYYALMKVPGQSFLARVRTNLDGSGDPDGYWFLSASEIARDGDSDRSAKKDEPIKWRMRRNAGVNGGGLERLIKPDDFLGRVWAPDYEFAEDVNTPMASLNGLCEQLHMLNESIAGRLRQRFALAGILLIPTEINDAGISGDKPRDALYSNDKVMNYLIHVMTTNVANHTEGRARIPILLKGPADVLEKVRHIVMDATIAETDLHQRGALIESIFAALDQQRQAVDGGDGGKTNHWGMWAVADEERRVTVVPDLQGMCHALTRMVLWPELLNNKRTPGSITPWRVWYDLSAAQVRSNQGEDGRQLWDRGGVSLAYLRTLAGATGEDAPDPEEYVRALGWTMKNPILATYGLEGVDVDWDRAAGWAKPTGPNPDSPGDTPEAGPGTGDPGSPDSRDSNTPKTQEPG